MELSPKATSFAEVVFYNVGTMFMFGFFHSLLARKKTKQWMNLPTAVERPIFCLQGAFFLHMIQHSWVDMEGSNFWDFSKYPNLAQNIMFAYWFGTIFLLTATFALDHFHLFGLSQGFGIDINGFLGLAPTIKKDSFGLSTRWHYRMVAHPIMTGMFLTFWVTPTMSPGRFVLACFLSLYIVIAVLHYEERAIREELGVDYDKYLAKTPRFFPNPLTLTTFNYQASTVKAD